jgi:DNA helicase-2/ATP-dependent DNA helicase PcrA
LLAAFNKIIANELQEKLADPRAEAKTLHSLGFSYILKQWDGVRVDEKRRGWGLVDGAVETSCPVPIKSALKATHTKVRELNPWAKDVQDIERVAVVWDTLPGEEHWTRTWNEERFYETVLAILEAAAEEPTEGAIDFSDMIYLPLRNGWVFPKYDLVAVDEAQDMTGPQLTMALRACRKDGRIVIVGDDRQAIYGFRGADSRGLDRLKDELQAGELGLTTTYRCGKSIVAKAAALVPDFVAPESAPEGVVRTCTPAEMILEAKEGDFILSRLNAPLMGVALDLIKRRVRARIRGREIGKGLIDLIERLRVLRIADLETALEMWRRREVARLGKQDVRLARAKMAQVDDTVDTLVTLADNCDSMQHLRDDLKTLFVDEDGGQVVMCSTVHKAKGLEADRVWVLEDTLRNGSLEEENIRYVAYTRARRELVLVGKEVAGEKPEPTVAQ